MKRFSAMIAAMAATSLVAAPAIAAPAQSLSVAKSVRASAPTGKGEKLSGGGGGIFAALIAAGVAAIVIVAAVDDDNSDSN